MTGHSGDEEEDRLFSDPRVAGVREHYERVKFFHALAERCSDPVGKFRLLVAGVYSARGVVELILDKADKGQLNRTRQDLEPHLRAQIPWYDLIERIRIHDFHRFGLVLPDPRFRVTSLCGPVDLQARKGGATYQVTASGPKKMTTGNSKIEEKRAPALLSCDGRFFDDATCQYVSLDQVLRDFASRAVETIEEFERNQRPSGQSA